jgi:guanine deaminase
MMGAFAIRCNAFHTPERGRLEVLADVLIEVSAEGVIERIGPADPARLAEIDALITLPEGHYLLPGLVDLHVHAPQWPQLGKALDVPLEEWLQIHTFPLEARYEDVEFARAVYAEMVDALLAHGTTTAVYFATIHVEATVALAEICLAKGQRALVGKVAMDDPAECPDFYRDVDAAAAIRGTRAVIDRIAALQADGNPLVRPAITPRFLPSCTRALLDGLGALARETGCHVQTHVSESDWEVAHGAARFGRSDVEALDGFGLLPAHAILAHCTFLTAEDRARIGAVGAAIAHCPLSNVYFAGEVLPARSILDEGLRIGLGTDISGGHSPSMLESARFAVTVSRMLDRATPGAAIGVAEAFWMATAGGGEALGLPIGLFGESCEFDAIAVGAHSFAHVLDDTPEDIFEKIVRRAGRDEIARVWVRGRSVSPS